MADFLPLKKIFASKNRDAERPQAGARFGISWPLLVALSLVLVCAVAWAFFMGYMVGKGEHPAESLGAMAGLSQPDAQQEQTVFVEPQQTEPLAETAAQPAPQRALAPPSGEAAAAWPQPVQKAERKQPAAKQKPAPAAKPAPGARYDYVFQTAAIRGKADAEKMRKKLADMKVRASVQKSGKVYLLMVNLRGDANDVADLREKLKSAHLGKPLQISKKPVEPAKKKDRRK